MVAAGARAEAPVQRHGAPRGALSGRVIALSPSHGRYYEKNLDRWEWQRARLLSTVEDLFTRSYAVPYLTPMLENAGAYVVMPRERDTSVFELVIDGDGGLAHRGYGEVAAQKPHKHNNWSTASTPGFGHMVEPLPQGHNPHAAGTWRMAQATAHPHRAVGARWAGAISETGPRAVYVSYVSTPESCERVTYLVHTAAGTDTVTVNQRQGGGTWTYLGTFPFEATDGERTLVELTTLSPSKGTVSADAVRIGGGMGNVGRTLPGDTGSELLTSGMPRYAEAARYWLQWAGMPDSVYSQTGGIDDYRDDIFARPMWVNHMVEQQGIDVDLMLALHTDAGVTEGDETVGTLGIFYTNARRGAPLTGGRKRTLCRQLADSVVTALVDDIRRLYDPDWTRRKLRDKSYIEIRVPRVPAMLLEMFSHQNMADMAYGHDPEFKFHASRAIYKGVLRYLAATVPGVNYEVQPLPVRAFAISEGVTPGQITLSWDWTVDTLEPTAVPTHYIIEERVGADTEPFRLAGTTRGHSFTTQIPPGQVHAFRVTAVNGGGHSFPSEVLAAGVAAGSPATVTVVNGFTRVSGPDRFYAGHLAGIGLHDPGVALGEELSFTGRQTEYDTTLPWVDDDAPGFGTSGAEWECTPLVGNSFDLPAVHGRDILAAGYSFVSSSAEAFSADTLSTPRLVDLIMGRQRQVEVGRGYRPAAHKAFTPELKRRLAQLSSRGLTGVLVSGAHIGSDLTAPGDVAWADSVFGFTLRAPVPGMATSVMTARNRLLRPIGAESLTLNNDLTRGPLPLVVSPDAIEPSGGVRESATAMRYGGTLMSAAVAARHPSHRTLAIGFPLESLSQPRQRQALMKQILNYLNQQ